MKVCGWMEVWLHTFVTYVLGESGWLDSGLSRLIPLLRASDIRWIGDWLGSRKGPGRFAEAKNVLIVPRSEPRIVQPVVLYLYRLRYLGSNKKITTIIPTPTMTWLSHCLERTYEFFVSDITAWWRMQMPRLLATCPKVEIISPEGASVMEIWVHLRADKRVTVRVATTTWCSDLVVNMGRCDVATRSFTWLAMLGVVTIPAQKLFMNTKVVGCRKQSFLKR